MSKLKNTNTKVCTKCLIPKSLDDFYKAPKHKDGLYYKCKDCTNLYKKEYRRLNQEKIRVDKRTCYVKNRLKNIENEPLKYLLYSTQQRAKRRKQAFEINYLFIKSIWNTQKSNCYYTGLPMEYTYSRKSPFQVSIDRKDSNIGYTKENTVLCCLSINYAKNNFTEKQLKEFLNSLIIKYK